VTGLGAILAVAVLAALWFVLWGLLKIREYHSLTSVVVHEHHHPAHARNGLDRPHRGNPGIYLYLNCASSSATSWGGF
jgi:hypothetical protein